MTDWLDEIKAAAPEIQAQAQAGDAKAKSVIACYQMWVKCPGDTEAMVFAREEFRAWKRLQELRAQAKPAQKPAGAVA